jgi:uracil-DNA glycosylase
MRLLIIGQNPATRENVRKPFENTPSGKTLWRWLEGAGVLRRDPRVHLINASDAVGSKFAWNKAEEDVAVAKMRLHLMPTDIVFPLGIFASKAVKGAGVPVATVVELPHPSGSNRVLNDPAAHADVIDRIRGVVTSTLDYEAADRWSKTAWMMPEWRPAR